MLDGQFSGSKEWKNDQSNRLALTAVDPPLLYMSEQEINGQNNSFRK